jgi:hypothetical protein
MDLSSNYQFIRPQAITPLINPRCQLSSLTPRAVSQLGAQRIGCLEEKGKKV